MERPEQKNAAIREVVHIFEIKWEKIKHKKKCVGNKMRVAKENHLLLI